MRSFVLAELGQRALLTAASDMAPTRVHEYWGSQTQTSLMPYHAASGNRMHGRNI